MLYKIDYQPENNLVIVEIDGRINFQIAQQYSTEAMTLGKRNQSCKYIIDHSKTDLHGDKNKIYASGAELEQFGFKRNDFVAIVVLLDENDERFIEPSNRNFGWSNFKYFRTIDQAFEWLKSVPCIPAHL